MELANQEYAARVVSLLIRSFPTQPSDPKTYASQLTTLCVGRPQHLLKTMVDPRTGLVATADFLPTVAEVRQWLDNRGPMPAFKPLPRLEEPEDPPEVREQRYNMLKAVSREIRDCVKSNCVGRPQISQINDWAKRNAALENLEAMNPQAEAVE